MLFATSGAACAQIRAPEAAAVPNCVFARADSLWLTRAIAAWTRIGEPLLKLDPQPLPPLILFDRSCTYQVRAAERWTVVAAPHRGSIRLPNAHTISPTGIGITSPTVGDSAIFLALALPDAWAADPRYRNSHDSRSGWEQYLIGAFVHEMTHARMLPSRLPQLRGLEPAIYPDTIEDNAIQNRFANDRSFAASVQRETELLHRAVMAHGDRERGEFVRSALALMQQRRSTFYVGDIQPWGELEQVFLDLEGVAQWAAFHARFGRPSRPSELERALTRFRASREFWSEDEGLLMVFALDAMVPDWQRQVFRAIPPAVTVVDLLQAAVNARM